MDFDQINAFINVASFRSFSEAAEKMFISQPSVSVRIKMLEEELGVLLFDRSKAREPVLTDAGRIFLDYAQSMLNLQEECREKLSGARQASAGLVYVGASTVPGTYLLPSLMARFRKIAPKIDINVNVLDTSAVLEGVLNYSYDFGLVGQINQDERFKYLSLYEDELILCAAKGLLPQADYPEGVPLEALFSMHLIMREKGSATRQLLEKKLFERGYDFGLFSGVTYINSLEGIKQAVREGLGIAFLSRLSVSEMSAAGLVDVFQLCDYDLRRSLYLVYHRSRILCGASERMKTFIMEDFTKMKR
jgi:DNA-binding transcriptional LysR family regulator